MINVDIMRHTRRNTNRGLPPKTRAEDIVVVRHPGKLRVHFENEAEYPERTRLELQRRAALALLRGADVPGRVQKGPTCGLYALGMVMDYWEKRDGQSTTALVQDSDEWRPGSHSLPPDTHELLLDVAQKHGFTTRGEMLDAAELAALAATFGYRAELHESFTIETILVALDARHPTLVAFDVDDDGNPGEFGGKNAHWAVIQAHFEDDGERFLVASHAWSGGEYVWKAEELMRSTAQLERIDVEAFPGVREDISQTLRRRLVEVYR